MKQLILFISLFFYSFIALSQLRTNHIPYYSNGDPNFWYSYYNSLFKEIGLTHLDNSQNPYHFRIVGNGNTIEIWKTSEGTINGKVVFWVKESVPSEETPTNRIHYQEFKMDSSLALQFFTLLDTSKVEVLPDEGQFVVTNGESSSAVYILEYSTKDDYYFKVYDPSIKKSRAEIGKIQWFNFEAQRILFYSKLIDSFHKTIPFESYYVCCPKATSLRNNLTSEQKKSYKKERNNWRKKNRL